LRERRQPKPSFLSLLPSFPKVPEKGGFFKELQIDLFLCCFHEESIETHLPEKKGIKIKTGIGRRLESIIRLEKTLSLRVHPRIATFGGVHRSVVDVLMIPLSGERRNFAPRETTIGTETILMNLKKTAILTGPNGWEERRGRGDHGSLTFTNSGSGNHLRSLCRQERNPRSRMKKWHRIHEGARKD